MPNVWPGGGVKWMVLTICPARSYSLTTDSLPTDPSARKPSAVDTIVPAIYPGIESGGRWAANGGGRLESSFPTPSLMDTTVKCAANCHGGMNAQSIGSIGEQV